MTAASSEKSTATVTWLLLSHEGFKEALNAGADKDVAIERAFMRLLIAAHMTGANVPIPTVGLVNKFAVRFVALTSNAKNRAKAEQAGRELDFDFAVFAKQEEHFKRCCNAQCGRPVTEATSKFASIVLRHNLPTGISAFIVKGYTCGEGDCRATFVKDLQTFLECVPDEVISDACAACGKSPATGTLLKQCTRCRIANYCSRDCHVKDWPEHKKVCKPAPAKKNS